MGKKHYEDRNLKFETLQLHVGQEQPDPVTDARAVPIYLTSSYVFHNSQHAADRFGLRDAGNIYGRLTNPTEDIFEKRIAALEGGVAALAVGSGAAALTYALQAVAHKGDHIVAAKNIYGGTYNLLAHTLPDFGIETTFVDPFDYDAIEAAIQDNTTGIEIETLGNPNSEVVDIERIANIAHAHNIPLIVDNTFATPYLVRPIEYGADIVVHSATKYLSGHNDVLAGVVVTSNQEFYDKLYYNLNTTGPTLSPFDSYMLMRGLKTLKLRMEASTANAQEVVAFLEKSPAVKEVLYPGKGGMISFKVANQDKIPTIINSLKVFTFAESLGGVESLITYPTTQTHADIPSDVRASYGLTDDLLRLSIGIEAAQDLIADLENALSL